MKGFDEVRGVIIGGNFYSGQLFYDGRPQGQVFDADDYDDLLDMLHNKMEQLITEYRPIGLYSDDDKWELRLSN